MPGAGGPGGGGTWSGGPIPYDPGPMPIIKRAPANSFGGYTGWNPVDEFGRDTRESNFEQTLNTWKMKKAEYDAYRRQNAPPPPQRGIGSTTGPMNTKTGLPSGQLPPAGIHPQTPVTTPGAPIVPMLQPQQPAATAANRMVRRY